MTLYFNACHIIVANSNQKIFCSVFDLHLFPQFERDSATHVFTLDFHFSLRYCGDNRSLVPQKKIIMIRQLVNFATANFTR